MSLLFHGDLVLLYLHSFPTRRSSDLVRGDLVVMFPASSQPDPISCGINLMSSRSKDRDINVAAQEFDLTAETLRKDRKSTRLNSSHVAISYAVFCLKKKNKI